MHYRLIRHLRLLLAMCLPCMLLLGCAQPGPVTESANSVLLPNYISSIAVYPIRNARVSDLHERALSNAIHGKVVQARPEFIVLSPEDVSRYLADSTFASEYNRFEIDRDSHPDDPDALGPVGLRSLKNMAKGLAVDLLMITRLATIETVVDAGKTEVQVTLEARIHHPNKATVIWSRRVTGREPLDGALRDDQSLDLATELAVEKLMVELTSF